MSEQIHIDVVYARPEKQTVLSVEVKPTENIGSVIEKSGILQKCPEIDLIKNAVGVFGQKASLTDLLHDGDRIEIYRPLVADPREIRRKRIARGER